MLCTVFLVPVPRLSSSRIAFVQSSTRVLTKISRSCHVVALGCSLRGDLFYHLFYWANRQEKNTKQWNEDRFIIYFDIERLPCKFVDENQRPSIDICTIRNSPELGTNLAQPPISVHWWGTKLSRSCQNVLKLLVREERTFTSERPVSQHAFVWDAIFV